jgi:hypothetical protein
VKQKREEFRQKGMIGVEKQHVVRRGKHNFRGGEEYRFLIKIKTPGWYNYNNKINPFIAIMAKYHMDRCEQYNIRDDKARKNS